jgi:hypothetical protein
MLAIKRGIITAFDPSTYTASVLIIEATSATLDGVPIANHIDGTSAVVTAYCAVLFFDEANPNDCVIIATYGNGANGFPVPPPGRVVFVAGFQQVASQVINAGTTQAFQISGNGGIPSGALGILFKLSFSSAAVPAHLDMAAHNGDLANTVSLGDAQAIGATVQGVGICPLDAAGKVDIRANGGNCTTSLRTYGYVF